MTNIPRRSLLKTAGTAVSTALLTTSSLPAVAQTDGEDNTITTHGWSMHRGDAARTGFSEAEDVGPAVRSRFYTEPSYNPSEPTELAVGDGFVFMTEVLDDVTERNKLVAYDQTSGERQWAYEPPARGGDTPDSGLGQVNEAPIVSDGTVYVASDGANNNGEWGYGGLFAFDSRTGETQWVSRDILHWRDQVLADGSLVAQDVKHKRVVAMNAATGEQEWAVGLDLVTSSLLAVHEGTVYVRLQGPETQYVAGFSLADGTEQWRHELPTDVAADERWGTRPDATVDGDTIYWTTHTENENALVAQSVADGTVRWNCTLTRSCGNPMATVSEPVLANGSVYAFTSANPTADKAVSASVWSVDIESGDREWAWTSPYPLYGSPTATAGRVYLGTDAPLTSDASGRYYDVAPISAYPTVVALDTADGDVAWAYAEPPAMGGEDELAAQTPIPTDEGIYVKATGNDRDASTRVLALEPTDQEIGPNHRPKDL